MKKYAWMLVGILTFAGSLQAGGKKPPVDVLVSDGRPLGAENTVTFTDSKGQLVGVLRTKDGKMSFEGNYEKSARLFLGYLKALYEAEYKAQQERNKQMAPAFTPAKKPDAKKKK